MGVTQAVLVNLTFFVPASSLMNLTILNLQRQGRLTRFERWIWIGVTLLVTSGLAIAVATDGHPIAQLSERVLWTEIIMSVVYAAIQAYYCVLQFRELQRMKVVIENYYDRERQGLTRWMKHAIGVNGLLAVFVPLLIFGPNIIIVGFSLCFFWGIFMMWFCFVRYFTGNAMWRVREAEENAREEKAVLAEFEVGLIASPAGGGTHTPHIVRPGVSRIKKALERVAEQVQRIALHH